MPKKSRNQADREDDPREDATSLETIIRRRARGLTGAIVEEEEELEAALGAAPSVRVGGAARQGTDMAVASNKQVQVPVVVEVGPGIRDRASL